MQKQGLSPRGRELIALLRVAQDPSKLADLGLDPDVISCLEAAGVLAAQDDTVMPTDLQETYVNWSSHRGMLLDHTRTRAFQSAIEALVLPGDLTIDVGTGSGILAMIAARAGAAQSIGLEFTTMADWAERLAVQNGLSTVRVIRGDAAGFQAEVPVDLVMGEFAGMWLMEEWRHYAAFCAVRNRNLKPGGKVLPRAARLFLSAVDSRKLYLVRGYGFWEEPAYGFDLSPIRAAEIASPRRWVVTADPNNIIDTQQIASFDFLTGSERDYLFTAETVFIYPAAGRFHGLVGHFELDLAPGIVISTGPFEHETHWHQSYFPIPAFDVPAGGEVAIRFRSFLDPVTSLLRVAIAVAPPGTRLTSGTPDHEFALE